MLLPVNALIQGATSTRLAPAQHEVCGGFLFNLGFIFKFVSVVASSNGRTAVPADVIKIWRGK